MKLFHLSDLHIGLKLMNRDLTEDQQYILNRIVQYAKEKQPDAVMIAGDIIQKNGSWFSYRDTRLGQGLDNVSNLIGDNPELYDELVNKLKSDE